MLQQTASLGSIVREFELAALHGTPVSLAGLPGRVTDGSRRLRVSGLRGLTLVVNDLASAGAALAAHLGTIGHAADPAELDEAGLAQVFELGNCRLLLFEPADDTDAGHFLQEHGPGVYRITLGAPRSPSTPPAAGAETHPASEDAPHEASRTRLWSRANRPAARERRGPSTVARRPFAAD
jgi:hypothetical protein